jgi:signal transduction histidine kinase
MATTCSWPVREALPELAEQVFFEAIDGVYQSGSPLHLPEAEIWADFEGLGQLERRYYSASFLTVTDAQGQVTGLLNVAFNVTAQVAARQQVQELNEELASINEELRASNEEDLATNTALSESQQLNQELEARVLEDVRLDLLPLLESTHAELGVDLIDCPRVRFSTRSLRSVLFNLLSNGVKYRAPDRAPQVQLRSQCTDQQVMLSVQDNGLGLSESQQSQLFTVFRRLHTHVEGSGVGLYLIKRLLKSAGGTIAVPSQLGVGSTFTVTLPRA